MEKHLKILILKNLTIDTYVLDTYKLNLKHLIFRQRNCKFKAFIPYG